MFVSSRGALAKWGRVGGIVGGFCCRREPPGARCRCLGEFYPVAGSRDGSADVQAGTCREERVECRWRPWPVLWLLSFLFVCSFCCFFVPKTAELWVWFLSPSLPPCDSFLFASPHTFASPASWANGLVSPAAPHHPGAMGDQGGDVAPPAACEGLGEESQCGKHTGLAPEPRALGVAPAASALETERGAAAGTGLTRRPLLSSPGWMSSHFAIIWSALDAERLKK